MSLRAYIGTARDVKFDDTVTEHTIPANEDEEEKTPRLKPIARDPILVMKYREAIKMFPNRRGKVDPTRVISRKNRVSSATEPRQYEHRDSLHLGLQNGRYNTDDGDDVIENDEEAHKETISQATYISTCRHYKTEPIPAIYQGLNKEQIVIKYFPIGELDIKSACVALVANTAVSTLDLTATDVGSTGSVYIADVLRENLYILDLNISENNIGTEGIASICEALQENRALKYLNVSGNKLTETDAVHIRDLMIENTTLKGLNISHNEFTDVGGVIIAEGIEGNDALIDIDFSWNHLRQRGARKIIEALLNNTTIKRADLSFNGFHDAARLLGELISDTTTLTYLDLTSNRLGDSDMGHIVKGFKQNDTLETFLIGRNPFTAPFCFQLLDIVCENPNNKIKELDLEAQSVEIAFLDLIYKTRQSRQLYINHGTVLKATLQREATDDFENADPVAVLMECIAQRQLKLVDLFQSIDKDDSKTITRTELREGLKSLNIPMSGKAVDKLMRQLDVDDNGEIDFAELMEGQREYYKKKKEREELGAAANHDDDGRMKEKVTKLIKMRRLAKMAQVLDTSTDQRKRRLSVDNYKKNTSSSTHEDLTTLDEQY